MRKINKYRIIFYCLGMIVLALGLTLNSKVDLGVSPIISIAFVLSKIYSISFANMTLILYTFFIIVEIIIHLIKHKRKSYLILDLLQLPFSIVFTRFMGLFDNIIPTFASDLQGTIYAGLPFRLFILALAIIFTGIGAITMLDMALIPNPGDGIVQAVASIINKDVSSTKTKFDLSCIVISLIICLIYQKGIIGINIGTILAMLGVGKVMGIYNKIALNFYNKKTQLSN